MGKKSPPEDIELFRRRIGDVRPLKTTERVPPPSPRDDGTEKPATRPPSDPVKEDADSRRRCPESPDKKMFDSMEEASRAADYVRQEWRKEVRPYHCFFCDKYHLTSQLAR